MVHILHAPITHLAKAEFDKAPTFAADLAVRSCGTVDQLKLPSA